MTLPRSFYFVRHGETDWNKAGLIQGFTDIPLNDTGRAQARAAAAKIAALPISHVVSSPLSRAHETARIVSAGLDVAVISDPRMRERNYGIFEGVSSKDFRDWQEKSVNDPGTLKEESGYPCPERAEPYALFRERVAACMAEHLHAASGDVLFVAHGGIFRVLRRLLTRDLGHSPNVKPFHFEKSGEIWVLKEI